MQKKPALFLRPNPSLARRQQNEQNYTKDVRRSFAINGNPAKPCRTGLARCWHYLLRAKTWSSSQALSWIAHHQGAKENPDALGDTGEGSCMQQRPLQLLHTRSPKMQRLSSRAERGSFASGLQAASPVCIPSHCRGRGGVGCDWAAWILLLALNSCCQREFCPCDKRGVCVPQTLCINYLLCCLRWFWGLYFFQSYYTRQYLSGLILWIRRSLKMKTFCAYSMLNDRNKFALLK